MNGGLKLLPVDERPREKAAQSGLGSLSNAELIAILLRTGTKDLSVLELANFVLAHFHGLRNLALATFDQLRMIKGMKSAKSLELLAAVELGKRISVLPIQEKEKIRSAERIFQLFEPVLKEEPQEHFYVVLLNTKNGLINYKRLFIGGLDTNLIHPRDIFREAVMHNAAKMIFVHNHPTGDPTPSEADIVTTQSMAEIGKMMGIIVLDHIIIGKGRFSSLKSLKHF